MLKKKHKHTSLCLSSYYSTRILKKKIITEDIHFVLKKKIRKKGMET